MKREYVKPSVDLICFDTEERITSGLEDQLSQFAAEEDARNTGVTPGFGSMLNPFNSTATV